MASYRCPRCWMSCDTRLKADMHYGNTNCEPKDKPADESFMDPSQEARVDGYLGKASTEDIWWMIFRILIPAVERIDDATLKLLYSPYYPDHVEGSSPPLMVPALSIPRNILHSMQPSAPAVTSLDSSAQGLPSFTIPVYESFQCDFSESTATHQAPSIFTTHSTSFGSQTDLSISTAGLSLDMLPASMTSRGEPANPIPTALTPKPGQAAISGQSQRNYERLMKQVALTEAENEKLRETNRANRTDLLGIQKLLERVLATRI